MVFTFWNIFNNVRNGIIVLTALLGWVHIFTCIYHFSKCIEKLVQIIIFTSIHYFTKYFKIQILICKYICLTITLTMFVIVVFNYNWFKIFLVSCIRTTCTLIGIGVSVIWTFTLILLWILLVTFVVISPLLGHYLSQSRNSNATSNANSSEKLHIFNHVCEIPKGHWSADHIFPITNQLKVYWVSLPYFVPLISRKMLQISSLFLLYSYMLCGQNIEAKVKIPESEKRKTPKSLHIYLVRVARLFINLLWK